MKETEVNKLDKVTFLRLEYLIEPWLLISQSDCLLIFFPPGQQTVCDVAVARWLFLRLSSLSLVPSLVIAAAKLLPVNFDGLV